MDQVTWNYVIAGVAGLIGGHGAGSVNQNTSLGVVGNTITGLMGGLAGGFLGALIPDLQQIGSGTLNGSNVGAGALGGIILTFLVGVLTNTGG